MPGTQTPYAYTPGRSLLHRWSAPFDIDGALLPAWGLRFTAKTLLFFALFYSTAQLHRWFASMLAATLHVATVGFAVLLLTITTGKAKAFALLQELAMLVFLGVTIGLPIYMSALLLGEMAGGPACPPVLHIAKSLLLMVVMVCATLACAALYLSTTSLSFVVRRMRGPALFRTVVALAFTYFPRFDENLRTAHLAFLSLRAPERWRAVDTPQRLIGALITTVRRNCLLVIAGIWDILTHTGLKYYLAFLQRDTHERSSS